MTGTRVKFVFKESNEEASKTWPTEAEARAYAAALQKSGVCIKIRLSQPNPEGKAIRLPLKVGGKVETTEDAE